MSKHSEKIQALEEAERLVKEAIQKISEAWGASVEEREATPTPFMRMFDGGGLLQRGCGKIRKAIDLFRKADKVAS
jgi:predicted metalloprotease